MRPTAWLLFGVLAFLYLNLFILPRLPIFLPEDAQIYLMNATRMLEGQIMYRDFFQITPPGTELVYFALFKLFGARAWILNAVLIFLGLGFAWLSVGIAKKVMSGKKVFLPGLLFLTFAFRVWFIGSTHNWYSVLAVLAAMAVVIEKRTPVRLVEAAVFCGLASFFTQTRGATAVLGLAVFLLWERRRRDQSWSALVKEELYLFATFFATVVATNAYLVQKAGLGRYLDCVVMFPLRYFSADSMYNTLKVYMTDLPELLSSGSWITYRLPALMMWFLIHALFPLVYAIFFMRYRREVFARPAEPWGRLMLINIMGLFLLVGIVSSPSWFRLCAVSPPALIILVWLVSRPGKPRKALAAFLWVVALLLAIAEPLERQTASWACLDAPPGRMAILDPDLYVKLRWLLNRTRPSDFFFRGIFPDYYFALGLRNPSKVPFITATDYTRPAQVQNVVESLEERRVRFALWSVWLDVPGDYRPEGDHLGPLRAYLRTHYHVVRIFSDADYEQVWERNQ